MIDGRVKHALLLEMFTKDGIGTEVTPSPVYSLMEDLQ
jgi:acetylglutamate kinase